MMRTRFLPGLCPLIAAAALAAGPAHAQGVAPKADPARRDAAPKPAAPKRSPAEVVDAALDAMNHGRIDTFVKAMHPDALAEFRGVVLTALDVAAAKGKPEKIVEGFQGVAGPDQLRALDGAGMMAAMIAKQIVDPEIRKALAATKIETVGRVLEGEDKAHVVYRSRAKLGTMNLDRVNVATVARSGDEWKMMLLEGSTAPFVALAKAGDGEPALPDFKAARVEPLGHVLDGKRTVLVVYRYVVPMNPAPMTKLAVLTVNAGEPGYDAARKDQAEVVKAMVEKSLGIRDQAPPPQALTPQPSPEVARARGEMQRRSQEFMEEAKRRQDQAREEFQRDSARRREEFRRESDRFMKNPGAGLGPDKLDLPAGLEARPASLFGGERDRFVDLAPAGGMLVGVKVSYITRFGGPKISSVQPVFRVGDKLVDGERHGTLMGAEAKAIAKPGYAVGVVKTRAGITVDGFEMVFMKVAGDKLDPSDAYNSPWLGDTRGGLPRDASGDGRIPAGLQGRAGEAVNALGLIVGPAKP